MLLTTEPTVPNLITTHLLLPCEIGKNQSHVTYPVSTLSGVNCLETTWDNTRLCGSLAKRKVFDDVIGNIVFCPS